MAEPPQKAVALYPGTFDPVTYGHLDIARRCVRFFDRVIVAVASNTAKEPLFRIGERLEMLAAVTTDIPRLEIASFEGLTVQFARARGASVIVRGLRAVSDFEEEFKMASANRLLAPEIDTVLLVPSQKYYYLNSSLVKEIARWGGDVAAFVPPPVQAALAAKFGEAA